MGRRDSRSIYFEGLIKRLLGPIDAYYDCPNTREIMINGPQDIFIEGAEGVCRLDLPNALFDHAALESLARAILQYSGKRLDPRALSQEARLPNKSRVHIVQAPAATAGLSITIRRFANAQKPLDSYATGDGSLTAEALGYIREAISAKKNIIVSGGTSTGKTVLLNAMAGEFEATERVITIEDVSEILLPQDRNVVTLEAQMPDAKGRGGITIRDLFRAALRMRPDRILVGECRGAEALDMLQSMNSGHAGALSTVHADTPARALSRLETLCLMDARDIPLVAIRRQLLEAIDVVIQVRRLVTRDVQTGATAVRRVISNISEISPNRDDGSTYDSVVQDKFHLKRMDHSARLERVV